MSSQHAALIVDADVQGLESLVYGFREADWRSTACPTPETASLLAKASGAQIAIVVSRSDHGKAQTLIRQLSAKGSNRRLPILVLGPEEQRKSLTEGNAADFLRLPVLVRDVLTASKILVEASSAALERPGEYPAIKFAAGTTSAASLLRTMSGLERSGQLRVERRGRQAEISFHEGEVAAAQMAQLQGMPAVQRVLIWDQEATLHLRPVSQRGQVNRSGRDFVDEIDCFQCDLAYVLKDIGPLSSIYACDQQRLRQSTTSDVPAEVTPVVRLCDGQRSLSDILDESPFPVLDTVRILARLVEFGIIARLAFAEAAAPTSAQEQLEAFWQTARIVIDGPDSVPGPSTSPAASGTFATLSSAASSGVLPVAPFAPAQSELVTILPTVPTAPISPPEPVEPPRRKTLEIAVPSAASSGSLPAALADTSAVSPIPNAPVARAATSQASGTIELQARKTQSSIRAVPARSSVVIDAVMESVTDNGSEAVASVTPSPSESATVRVTGEIQSVPSRRLSKSLPAGRVSIQLDAAFGDAYAPTPAAPQESHSPAPAAAPIAVPAAEQPTPSRAATPASGRQQSGHFSPIEKDFFAREADLYKVDGSESFADLVAPAEKNGAGKKPNRK